MIIIEIFTPNKQKLFFSGDLSLYINQKILRQNSAAQFMNKTMEEAFVMNK